MEVKNISKQTYPEGTKILEVNEYTIIFPSGKRVDSIKESIYILQNGKWLPYVPNVMYVSELEKENRSSIKEPQKSKCDYGESCYFAHGRHQLRCLKLQGHDPNCYLIHDGKKHNRQTTLCQRFSDFDAKNCPYGLKCNFYHCKEEQRCSYGSDCQNKDTTCYLFHDDDKNNYWTIPCKHVFNEGKTKCRKNNCTFAHSEEELRCKYGNECHKKNIDCRFIHEKEGNNKTEMCWYISKK